MRTFLTIFILLISISCAKNSVEKTDEVIDVALTHLSNEECDEALDVLGEVDNDNTNAIYLQVLASAYACKASFDEISFVSVDLAALNTTSTSTIMKSFAIFSLSPETAADSTAYTSIRTAINVLLDSTTGSPSQVARNTKFGTRKAGDMGVQALFLNIVNLGKFLNFYGNVDSLGVKGQGTNTNSCFIDYNDARAQAVVAGGVTGACTTNNDGHPDLDQTTATGKRRLCEGLVLITNFIDILDNLDLSGSSELSDLEAVATQVNTIKTAAGAAGIGYLMDITSQSECETQMGTASKLDDMEYLYSLIFESGLQ